MLVSKAGWWQAVPGGEVTPKSWRKTHLSGLLPEQLRGASAHAGQRGMSVCCDKNIPQTIYRIENLVMDSSENCNTLSEIL